VGDFLISNLKDMTPFLLGSGFGIRVALLAKIRYNDKKILKE
jgi:hypothetical protein